MLDKYGDDAIHETAKQYFMTGNIAKTQEISFLISKSRIVLHDEAVYNLLAPTTTREFY